MSTESISEHDLPPLTSRDQAKLKTVAEEGESIVNWYETQKKANHEAHLSFYNNRKADIEKYNKLIDIRAQDPNCILTHHEQQLIAHISKALSDYEKTKLRLNKLYEDKLKEHREHKALVQQEVKTARLARLKAQKKKQEKEASAGSGLAPADTSGTPNKTDTSVNPDKTGVPSTPSTEKPPKKKGKSPRVTTPRSPHSPPFQTPQGAVGGEPESSKTGLSQEEIHTAIKEAQQDTEEFRKEQNRELKLQVVEFQRQWAILEEKRKRLASFATQDTQDQLQGPHVLKQINWKLNKIQAEQQILKHRITSREAILEGTRPYYTEVEESDISDGGYSENSDIEDRRYDPRVNVRRRANRVLRPVTPDKDSDQGNLKSLGSTSTEPQGPSPIPRGGGKKPQPTPQPEPPQPQPKPQPQPHPKPLSVPHPDTQSESESESEGVVTSDDQLDSEMEDDFDQDRGPRGARQNGWDPRWSVRDIPKFRGVKGEDPRTHWMAFSDFMDAIGRPLPKEDRNQDCAKQIQMFGWSLIDRARQWWEMFVLSKAKEGIELNTYDALKKVKSIFFRTFSPKGGTMDQLKKAWKELTWDPSTQDIQDFAFEFISLCDEMGENPLEEYESFKCCIPGNLQIFLENATTIEEAVRKIKQYGQAMPYLFPQNVQQKGPKVGPSIPFMSAKTTNEPTELLAYKSLERALMNFGQDMSYEIAKLSQALEKNSNEANNKRQQDWRREDNRDRSKERRRNDDRRRDWSRDRDNNRYRTRDRRSDWRSRDRSSSDSRSRSGSRNRSWSRDRNRENGDRDQRRSTPNCTHCRKGNHQTWECYKLRNHLQKGNAKIVRNENYSSDTDSAGSDNHGSSLRKKVRFKRKDSPKPKVSFKTQAQTEQVNQLVESNRTLAGLLDQLANNQTFRDGLNQ